MGRLYPYCITIIIIYISHIVDAVIFTLKRLSSSDANRIYRVFFRIIRRSITYISPLKIQRFQMRTCTVPQQFAGIDDKTAANNVSIRTI